LTFTFRLEHADGTPADPPELVLGVYLWNPGDAITLGAGRSLHVVALRDDDPDQPPALVVEDAEP
jgi:hypothetical protein